MKSNVRQFFSQLTYIPATLRHIWNAAHKWTTAWGVLLLIQGIMPAASVYLTRLLVDNLVMAVGSGVSWENIQKPLLWAAFLGLTMLLTQVLSSVMQWVYTAQSELVRDYFSALVHEKSYQVDLAFYESPEYHDRMYRARNDLQSRPLALLESSGGFIQSGITLFAMASLLIPYGLWIPLLLIISTLPAFYVVLKYNRRVHRWWEDTTTTRRWTQYYDTVLTSSITAAEVRLFQLGHHFKAVYQSLRCQVRNEQLDLIKRQSVANLGAGMIATLVSGLAMGWMVWRAFMGMATLGDLTLFYQAFNKGQGLLGSVLRNVGSIYDNTLFLGNLFEFLELQPEIRDPKRPIKSQSHVEGDIRFENVTFGYPGAQQPVLKDFNLTIPSGKIVAIVGANGAGKSTLIKLICRFYDPEQGSVNLNEIDLRQFSVADLRRMITGMFQQPVPYVSTVSENIKMGDLAEKHSEIGVQSAARSAGAHEFVMQLPNKYETLLGKLFASGTELSGGEWQRLALARSFLRQAQIMILDEPTSALDSWSEADWFDRFRMLAEGRTAVIITHRLTIARHADVIHVMDKGQMIESGSHDELLALNGRYASSWQQQIEEKPGTDQSSQNGNHSELVSLGE